ncbi:MAG: protein-glutamine gamma-glutamyltransferase [Eubacteriaceae bacterium]
MILINNTPIQIEEWNSRYPDKSLEREVLEILIHSEEVYFYESIEDLEFELLLRKEIVHSADRLNKSGLKFKVFRESICNEKYWERMNNGGFQLKKQVKANEAIGDIYENGLKYGTECATAILIVYYGALLSIYTEEQFNTFFSDIIIMNWHLIHPLLKEVGLVNIVSEHLPGDRRYFINPDVDPLHPEWQGENVIDMGNGIYYGHGAGKKSAKWFIDKLNKLRKEDAKISAYFMEEAGRPNIYNLGKLYAQSIIESI